jgi:CRP-like cAMP-binding protein
VRSNFNSYATGLLEILSKEAQIALLSAGRRIHFSDGQIIQSRGQYPANLLIVLSGGVRMFTIGLDGSSILTAVLGVGQQFNEVTFFSKTVCPHDAVAVEDTELLSLTQAQYESVSSKFPEIVQALLVSNVHRVHQLVEALNDLRGLPKQVALARILLKNALHVLKGSDQVRAELEITQEDIALFLGLSRPYINKIFGQLAEEGLIKVSYKKILVLDVTALQKWTDARMVYSTVEYA